MGVVNTEQTLIDVLRLEHKISGKKQYLWLKGTITIITFTASSDNVITIINLSEIYGFWGNGDRNCCKCCVRNK